MEEYIKIGSKYHLLADVSTKWSHLLESDVKTKCGKVASRELISRGPVPFGTLCEKCKEVRAMQDRSYI